MQDALSASCTATLSLRIAGTPGPKIWAIALVLACGAQLLVTVGQLWPARIAYLVAAALGLVAVNRIDRLAPPTEPPAMLLPVSDPPTSVARRTIAVVLGASTTLLSAFAVPALVAAAAFGLAAWLWIVALVGFVAAGVAWSGRPWIRIRPYWPMGPRLGELAIVLFILVVAVALRFPNLSTIPPEVHGDEAMFGHTARSVARGEKPNLFAPGDNHVGDQLNGLAMRVLGDDLGGLRGTSAVVGTLSVLLLYLIARRLFGVRPALLSAWLLGVAQWHVHYSRDGITVIHAVLAMVLFLWLLVRALDTGHPADFILAGFAAGLCFHVYYPARLAPVLGALYVLYRSAGESGFLARRWSGLLAGLLGGIAFLAPFGTMPGSVSTNVVVLGICALGLYAVYRLAAAGAGAYLGRLLIVGGLVVAVVAVGLVARGVAPGNLTGRLLAVSVFSEHNLRHAFGAYRVDRVDQMLAIQTIRTLEAFNYSGETSQQYFRRRVPLLDFWTGAMLVPGIVLLTARARRHRYFLLASWIWLTLVLGSILTVDAPFSPRITAVVPALMVAPALFLDAGWRGAEERWGRPGSACFGAGVGLLLALALVANYRDYFHIHITEFQPAGFNTMAAREIERINPRYRIYLLSGQGATLTYDTPRFLVPNVDGESVGDRPLELPLRQVPETKGVAFLIQAGTPLHDERLAQIRAAYVETREESTLSSRGTHLFTTVLVERDELIAALRRAVSAVPGSIGL